MRPLFRRREFLIERDVERQHVHARLAEKSPVGAIGELRDQRFHLLRGNAAGLADARRLYLGIRRTDLRIETRG